jgi:hypothetical protein
MEIHTWNEKKNIGYDNYYCIEIVYKTDVSEVRIWSKVIGSYIKIFLSLASVTEVEVESSPKQRTERKKKKKQGVGIIDIALTSVQKLVLSSQWW